MMRLTLGVDHLSAAVANDLASRYCPVDRALFLGRLGVLTAACAAVVLAVFMLGRFRANNPQRKELAVIAAYAIAFFAAGGGALVLFGLSGCLGQSVAGLTWDWPW
jgi:hypothetical protein